MHPTLQKLHRIGLIPSATLPEAPYALPLARALLDGGLPCVEIMLHTDAAMEAIRLIRASYPDLLVGAGDVPGLEQIRQAVLAGAAFVRTACPDPRVAEYCRAHDVLVLADCSNGEQAARAAELGLSAVSLVPGLGCDGLHAAEQMSARFPQMALFPVGNVTLENLPDYLGRRYISACFCKWIADAPLFRPEEIARLARQAVDRMLGFHLAHVGINMLDGPAATALGARLQGIFGFPLDDRPGSVFAGSGLEICKQMFLGQCGHIAIKTSCVERAMFHLEHRGVEFDPGHIKYGPDGLAQLAYFQGQLGGFAFHLC